MKTLFLWSLLLFSNICYSIKNNELDAVFIPLNKWASQRVLSKAIGQIIEKSGTPVEYINISADKQWGAIQRGVIHFQLEVWEPSMKKEFESLIASGQIVDLGTHDAKVIEEWWYPKYVEELCPELPNWRALNKCKKLFETSSSNSKGLYYGGPWNYGDAEIIRALGINYTIGRLTDASELWDELSLAISNKRPIILLNWSPNWTDNYISGEFVNFPLYTKKCGTDPEWGLNKKLINDCGNRRNGWLKKAGSMKLKESFPCVFRLVQNINFTNQMIRDASSLTVVKKLSDDDAAIKWSRLYANEIKKWISKTCI
ncbi:MAG: ABC transporter substrate-binding protein [Colwellia sp.]|jgi:glycine betaine/proline transport system substrate-binding protein